MPLAGLHGANQYAFFTKEATWGTFDGSATAGNKFVAELEEGNAPPDRKVQTKDTRAATGNIPTRHIGSRYEVTGSYKLKLFPETMLRLIPWLCTPTVVSGRLTLPSFTVDWFDGLEPRRFRGCRLEEGTLDFTADGQWGTGDFKYRGMDQDPTPPTLTAPLIATYPVVSPTILQATAGQCTFNGATLAAYRALKINIKNILDPQFDEQNFLNSLEYCGRDVTAEFTAKLTSAARKTLYEAQTATTALFKWIDTGPGPLTYTTTLDMQATAYIENRTVDRSFGKTQYETIMLKAFRDATSGVEFVGTSAAA